MNQNEETQARMHYGYNLFIPSSSGQGRVRNDSLAKTWSHYLENCTVDDNRAHDYVHNICFAPWTGVAEQRCLDLLSRIACAKIRQIYEILYPGKIVVFDKDREDAERRLWKPFKVLPNHCHSLVDYTANDAFLPLPVQESRWRKFVLAAPVREDITAILSQLAPRLTMVEAPSCPFIYLKWDGRINLNWSYYATKSTEQMINHVAFHVMPALDQDTLPLAKRLLKRVRDEDLPPPVPGYKWVRAEYSLVPE